MDSNELASCIFCSPAPDRIVIESALVWTLRDAFPVSPGHTLVIPRRHIASIFDATADERTEMFKAAATARAELQAALRPDGFNLGINEGTAAGQTVMHLHLHLIPRYRGDMADPRGGVRHCVAGKGYY